MTNFEDRHKNVASCLYQTLTELGNGEHILSPRELTNMVNKNLEKTGLPTSPRFVGTLLKRGLYRWATKLNYNRYKFVIGESSLLLMSEDLKESNNSV